LLVCVLHYTQQLNTRYRDFIDAFHFISGKQEKNAMDRNRRLPSRMMSGFEFEFFIFGKSFRLDTMMNKGGHTPSNMMYGHELIMIDTTN
jgi:hypothetical protein